LIVLINKPIDRLCCRLTVYPLTS